MFLRAMDKDGARFHYLKEKLGLRVSDAKIKEGIFVGHQIRVLTTIEQFGELLRKVKSQRGTHLKT